VILEMDDKPPQTFKSCEAFAELPGMAHKFRNASASDPAKALGFQVAPNGVPLQTNVRFCRTGDSGGFSKAKWHGPDDVLIGFTGSTVFNLAGKWSPLAP